MDNGDSKEDEDRNQSVGVGYDGDTRDDKGRSSNA